MSDPIDDPDDPDAKRVWDIVTKLRGVLRQVDEADGMEALAVVIADMLSNIDEPEF